MNKYQVAALTSQIHSLWHLDLITKQIEFVNDMISIRLRIEVAHQAA